MSKLGARIVGQGNVSLTVPPLRVGEKEPAMSKQQARPEKIAPNRRLTSCGFSLIELLIVVAIILIIAAIAIPNFMRSRMAANESATVQNMRNICTANVAYSTTYGIGFSSTLAKLGSVGGVPSAAGAQLIDDVLATGSKSGYIFTYISTPPQNGVIYDYSINTSPINPGSTGSRYFYTDQTGVIRQNNAGVAGPLDPPIG